MSLRGFVPRAFLALGVLGLALCAGPRPAAAANQETAPPAAVHEHTPAVHAFTNARIVVAPGRVIARGTLVARDGVITAVGASVKPPADAVVHELAGKTLYPAFIESYSEIGLDRGAWGGGSDHPQGATYWNRYVVPQRNAALEFEPDTAAAAALRSQGFATALVAPSWGVVKGTGAVVSLGEGSGATLVVKPQAALHIALTQPGWYPGQWDDDIPGAGYPTSPMGAYALVRQALYDADWYVAAHAAWSANPSLPRPETDEALATLAALRRARVPLLIDTTNELYALRADRIGREFGLDVIVRGSGREYRRLDAIRAAGRAILVPVNFPKAPTPDTPEDALNVSLEALLDWDLAPGNAAALSRAGVPIALTTYGLEDRHTFLAQMRRAVARGLAPDAALAALTTTPARLLGLASRLGTLEAGKAANLIVADGDLFAGRSEIREVWVDGARYDVKPALLADARGDWIAEFTPRRFVPGDTLWLRLGGSADSLGGRVARGAKSAPASLSLLDTRLFATFAADSLGVPGTVRMSGAVSGARMLGEGTWPDGAAFTWTATRVAPYAPPPDTAKSAAAPDTATFPVRYPLQAFGRLAAPKQPAAVLFRGATVWTCGPTGTLADTDVLVTRGRIAAVGRGLRAPAGAVVVDARDMHLTPGIIDCHSHLASDGGINEGSHSATPEVRMSDFVDPDDVGIYRQLGGGQTASHSLHGSSNTVGGQNQLLKLRWGADPEALKFEGAPPTIKFALGENVKQSWNPSPTGRFPQSRMGVEQVIRDQFQAAREYRRAWQEWRRTRRGIPPRRDLGHEAIVEVLEGKRAIHCHSYRQDELLMFMRVCDEFGVRNVTYQHVSEGYKVADEMVRRGDGASSIPDWWAYKIEVYDAIPQNAALMHDVGVVASIGSDSEEMGRRLNQEAGKSMQYGELSPEEALKLVTLNPAKQLRVDNRVGSIEVGKDADLALWNGPPVAQESRCEQTWIDGRKYFDRADDLASRAEMERMKETLLQKALRAGRK